MGRESSERCLWSVAESTCARAARSLE
jgi:hypothetical protein